MKRSQDVKRKQFTRRKILGMAAGMSAAMTMRAGANTWPARTVRLIIPFTAGGPTDIQGRVIAEKLQAKWGQPVVVENKPGAGSTIGSNLVAQAEPDGYTLLLQGSAHATNASLFLNLPYHPVRSFTPIMGVSFQPVILTVHPSVPVKTLKEFIDLAKREPDTITMGVAGTGNISHLAGILLEQVAGIKLVTVPFGGSSQAQTALLGGHIKGSFLNSTVGTPVIKSNSVVGVASASKGRWRELPDLPTIAEQGYPDFECTSWYGLLGPKGMPEAVARQVYEDTRAVLKMDDVRQRLFASGLDLLDWSPAQFTAVMEADMQKWPPIIARGGLKPQ
jgi:tripartite-type tricarboxylate transporter receptor subunit TctC